MRGWLYNTAGACDTEGDPQAQKRRKRYEGYPNAAAAAYLTWRKCLVFESYRLDTMSQARQILAENFIFYTEEWLNRDYHDRYFYSRSVDNTRYELYVDKKDFAVAMDLLETNGLNGI